MITAFKIALRFCSEDFNFQEIISDFNGYNYSCHKKNESIFPMNKNSQFKAKTNVLVVDDIAENNFDNTDLIINDVSSILKLLVGLNYEISKELYITATIYNQQFGFSINTKLLNYLSANNISFAFSSISFLEDGAGEADTKFSCAP